MFFVCFESALCSGWGRGARVRERGTFTEENFALGRYGVPFFFFFF